MRSLNWSEAFRRLRVVGYVIAAVVTTMVAAGNMPNTKPAYVECAREVRNLVRTADNPLPQPLDVSDEQFCTAVAERMAFHLTVPAAQLVAYPYAQDAKRQSLTVERIKHFGYVAAIFALIAGVLEALARGLVWALRGLFAATTQ
ncbi:MAG: hypothetical protein KIH64_014990 [Mycobacterium sp.]|nr:hypothetical protein [Mycobacterium sp.]